MRQKLPGVKNNSGSNRLHPLRLRLPVAELKPPALFRLKFFSVSKKSSREWDFPRQRSKEALARISWACMGFKQLTRGIHLTVSRFSQMLPCKRYSLSLRKV